MHEDLSFTTRAARLSADRRVEERCDAFEAQCKAGANPRIEDYLSGVAGTGRKELLGELLRLELSYIQKRGQQQPPAQPYRDRFQAERDVVDRVFRELTHSSLDDGTRDEAVSESAPEQERPNIGLAFPEGSRWVIQDQVGAGQMGVVYRAFDRKLDIQVAIKLLLPGYSRHRFVREAQTLAKISSDHVVRVYDYELLTGDYPILVMQWIDGLDLLKTIRAQRGALPEDRVLRWMRQVCEGMRVAADQDIIHRDLKPSNILIDSTGKARVVDFGLARGPNAVDLSGSTHIMGTPLYMAPEQAEDPKSTGTRSDIYSFGATFYHALTGQPPFTGPSVFSVLLKHKTEPLVPPIVRNPQISRRTSDILERCLAKSAAERFQSFGQVLSELLRLDSGSPWDTSEDTDLLPYLMLYRRRRESYLADSEPLGRVDRYDFPGDRRLLILEGNIVEQDVDAIVSSSDQALSMNSGVSRALRSAAGEVIFKEARQYAPVRPGRAVVTSAGALNARFVLHGITSGLWQHEYVPPSRDIISEILASCFYHAESLNVQSISFPLLGTGAMGFPRDVCLDTMFRFLVRTLLQSVTPVQEVRIVLFSEDRFHLTNR
jgi:serine/threonine protein kinase